ncbi:hypothetical protein [Streptomyces chattanoogensis]
MSHEPRTTSYGRLATSRRPQPLTTDHPLPVEHHRPPATDR